MPNLVYSISLGGKLCYAELGSLNGNSPNGRVCAYEGGGSKLGILREYFPRPASLHLSDDLLLDPVRDTDRLYDIAKPELERSFMRIEGEIPGLVKEVGFDLLRIATMGVYFDGLPGVLPETSQDRVLRGYLKSLLRFGQEVEPAELYVLTLNAVFNQAIGFHSNSQEPWYSGPLSYICQADLPVVFSQDCRSFDAILGEIPEDVPFMSINPIDLDTLATLQLIADCLVGSVEYILCFGSAGTNDLIKVGTTLNAAFGVEVGPKYAKDIRSATNAGRN